MSTITTQFVNEDGACFTQWVISDPEAATALTITPERGGMITGFTLDGEDFIWRRHPNFGRCERPRFGVPVLFPSCGKPEGGVHHFESGDCPMEIHGLADLAGWNVKSVGPDGVTLELKATPLTKFLYPFDFVVLMNYTLEGNTAALRMTVRNCGEVPMPFSFGYHPYFAVSALENVSVRVKCATCADDFAGEQVPAPETITSLPIDRTKDSTICVMQGVQFPMVMEDSGNGHRVTVQADEHFHNGVLWQQSHENFICVEPWNGWPNSVNEEGRHEILQPGEELTSVWTMTIEKI